MLLSRFAIPLLLAAWASAGGAEDARELRALTFNIRYGTAKDENHRWEIRRDAVLQVIQESGADFVGLQEALDFQIDEILKGVDPRYTAIGEGREGGRNGEHASILYDSEKYSLLRAGRFWLSETPDRIGSKSWSDLPRIVTWVEVVSRDGESRKVLALNTHFCHRSDEARARSARLILERLENISDGNPDATLLMGDFNCPPGSPPHVTLTDPESGRFQDVQILTGSPEQRTFNGFREAESSEGRPIDWILVRGSLKPTEYRVLTEKLNGVIPSDHHPVFARFTWTDAD